MLTGKHLNTYYCHSGPVKREKAWIPPVACSRQQQQHIGETATETPSW
jgi:hypothetical protein